MKYVQFTYVDAQTNVPLSEAPAPNGIKLPDNVVPTFDIESSRSQQAPIIYGFVEKGDIPSHAVDVGKDEFFNAFKQELKQRAVTKRKVVERSGITYKDVYISTTEAGQTRLNNAITGLERDDSIKSVDYETSQGEFLTFTREEMFEIGKAVNKHVQSCFSECRKIVDDIDNMKITIKSLDKAMPIIEAINSFGNKE